MTRKQRKVGFLPAGVCSLVQTQPLYLTFPLLRISLDTFGAFGYLSLHALHRRLLRLPLPSGRPATQPAGEGVSRHRDSSWGVRAEVLRWALFYTVATPGTWTATPRGVRREPRRGMSLESAPRGSRGMPSRRPSPCCGRCTRGFDAPFHRVRPHAWGGDRPPRADRDLSGGAGGARPRRVPVDLLRHSRGWRPCFQGEPGSQGGASSPLAFGAPDLGRKVAEALAIGAMPSTVQTAAALLIDEARSELERLEAPSPNAAVAAIFGELPSNLSSALSGRRKPTQPRLALWHARWLLFLENVPR